MLDFGIYCIGLCAACRRVLNVGPRKHTGTSRKKDHLRESLLQKQNPWHQVKAWLKQQKQKQRIANGRTSRKTKNCKQFPYSYDMGPGQVMSCPRAGQGFNILLSTCPVN